MAVQIVVGSSDGSMAVSIIKCTLVGITQNLCVVYLQRNVSEPWTGRSPRKHAEGQRKRVSPLRFDQGSCQGD